MNSLGKVGILGDSISTFMGYIPKGYYCFYDKVSNAGNDVSKVEETWWHQVIEKTGSTLGFNSSFSGATVCYTGYSDWDEKLMVEASFVERAKKYYNGKEHYDTIFVFGGTNDNWSGSPIGKEKHHFVKPKDLKNFHPAIWYLAKYLRKHNKNTRIIFIINTELKAEIVYGIVKACKKFGHEFITLAPWDPIGGHPSVKGMEQIANNVLNHLNK